MSLYCKSVSASVWNWFCESALHANYRILKWIWHNANSKLLANSVLKKWHNLLAAAWICCQLRITFCGRAENTETSFGICCFSFFKRSHRLATSTTMQQKVCSHVSELQHHKNTKYASFEYYLVYVPVKVQKICKILCLYKWLKRVIYKYVCFG